MKKNSAAESKTQHALRSWLKLNRVLGQLSEAQVSRLLEVEQANKRRVMILRRLHQRLTTLRAKRERKELGIGK